MKWYRKLYLGENVKKSREQLIRKLETNAGMTGIYIITLSCGEHNLCEYFSSKYLQQPVIHEICPEIIGLAKGEDEAQQLVMDILIETFHATGGFDIRKYLETKAEEPNGIFYEYPAGKLKKRKRFLFGS